MCVYIFFSVCLYVCVCERVHVCVYTYSGEESYRKDCGLVEGAANVTEMRMDKDEKIQNREVHKPIQYDSKLSLKEGDVQQEISENTNGQGICVSK